MIVFFSFLHFVHCAQTLSAGEVQRPGRTKKKTAPGGFEQFLFHLNASTPNEATSTLSLEQQDEDNTLSDVLSLSSVVEPSPITSYDARQPLPQPPAISLGASSRVAKSTVRLSKTPYHVRYPLQERTDFSPGEVRLESVGVAAKQDNRSGNLCQSEGIIDLSLMVSEGEVPTIILADGGQTSRAKKNGRQKAITSPGESPFPQHELRNGIDVINISRSSTLSVSAHGWEEKRGEENLAANSLGISRNPQEVQRTPNTANVSLPPGIISVKPLSTAGSNDSKQEVMEEGDKSTSGSDAAVDAPNMEIECSSSGPEHEAKSSSPTLPSPEPEEDGSVEASTNKAAAQSSVSCTPDSHHSTSSPFHLLTPSIPPSRRPPPPINVPTAAVDVEPSSSSAVSAGKGPGDFEQPPTPSYSSDFDFSSVSLVSFH